MKFHMKCAKIPSFVKNERKEKNIWCSPLKMAPSKEIRQIYCEIFFSIVLIFASTKIRKFILFLVSQKINVQYFTHDSEMKIICQTEC